MPGRFTLDPLPFSPFGKVEPKFDEGEELNDFNRFSVAPSPEELKQSGIPTAEEESLNSLSFLAEFGNVGENILSGLLAGGLIALTGGGAIPVIAGGIAVASTRPLLKKIAIGALKTAKDFTLSGLDDLAAFIGKKGLKKLRGLSTSKIRTTIARSDDIGMLGSILPTSNRIKPGDKVGRDAIDALNLTNIKMRLAVDLRNNADAIALKKVKDFNFFDIMDGKDFVKNVVKNPKLTGKQKLAAKYLRDKFETDRGVIIKNLRAFARPKIEGALTKAIRKVVKDGTPAPGAVDKKLKELIPDDWGLQDFLPHIFPGDHIVVDKFSGANIGTYNTILEAKIGIMELAEIGALTDANSILIKSRSFLDPQSLSTIGGKQQQMIKALENGATITESEVKKLMGGNLRPEKRQKFWGSLEEREGVEGFSTNMSTILKLYNSGIERWIQLTSLTRTVDPLILQLQKEGRVNLVHELQSLVRGLWGHIPDTSRLFDAGVAKIPIVNQIAAPRILDRWARRVNGAFVMTYLKLSPRFQALNALQTMQTLWPIVSTREFFRGVKLLTSREGKRILQEFNIDTLAKGGKLWGETSGIGPAEVFNQKLAFLTMFEKGLTQNLTRRKAADYALLRGNLYTQFLGLQSDIPKAFRTAEGLPSTIKSQIFMFKRFPIKDLKIFADLLRDKHFVGAGKWMGAHLLLGGMKFLTKPFGIATGVGGVVMYNAMKEKYGEATADLIDAGAPGLIGLDMSGSVQIVDPPFGNTLGEKVANVVMGPIGTLVNSVAMAVTTNDSLHSSASRRVFETLIARVPALKVLDGLHRIWTQDYNFEDPKGRLKFEGDMTDVLKQTLAFKSLKQSRQQEMLDEWRNIVEDYNTALNKVAGRLATVALKGGHPTFELYAPVTEWNSLWPEFGITGTDIQRRVESRLKSATTPRDLLAIERGPKRFRARFLEIRRQQRAKPVTKPTNVPSDRFTVTDR